MISVAVLQRRKKLRFIASVPQDAKIDRSEDVFVEYPVRVISVAVLVTVV